VIATQIGNMGTICMPGRRKECRSIQPLVFLYYWPMLVACARHIIEHIRILVFGFISWSTRPFSAHFEGYCFGCH
ncbi:hypothetical protein HAX54_022464, partial [Datura stramonium]|nr:hypothetical protein [Datura stramonium]